MPPPIATQNLLTSRSFADTVQNNGGGYVYLSGVLQLALAGGQYEPDLNFEVLFRKSNLSEAAVQAYVDRPTTVQGCECRAPGLRTPPAMLTSSSSL